MSSWVSLTVRSAVLVGLLLVLAASAHAHPLAPALLSLEQAEDGAGSEVDVRWKVSLLRPTGSDVRPVLPDHCRPLTPSSYVQGPNDLTESWRVDCGARGLVGATVSVTGLDRSRTDALLHLRLADGRTVRGLVNAEQPSFVVPERESALAVVRSYSGLGVEHLLFGLDHVLFVLALVLLVRSWRTLLATITSFTVGHSATLSLAALGVVSVPTRLFELAIAFSILVLAAELARRPDSRASSPEQAESAIRHSAIRRRPWTVAGGFGLLHGLGFAGALSQIGLPQGEIPLALFSFNVGVEIGQLLVVAPVIAVVWLGGERLRALASRAMRVPAYGIGSLAGYWFMERAALFF